MRALQTSLLSRGGRSRLVAGSAVTAFAALALAGCGGVGGTKPYTPAATEACLKQTTGVKIVPVNVAVDFVASSALGGALAAKLALNSVTISFGRDAVEGSVIQKAYAKYGSKSVPIDQVLELRRNAVLLWAGAPSKQDAAVVRGCLKS